MVDNAALVAAGARTPSSPAPQDAAVFVRGLRKAYGALNAVDGVDLEISRGEVFALLGPNGAGKTTTVEILEGYRHRDDGQVTVLGHDPGRERSCFEAAYRHRASVDGGRPLPDRGRDPRHVRGLLPPPQVAG